MAHRYTIQAYQEMNYKGELKDVANVQVQAENEAEALEKAKTMVTKKFYRVGNVQEVVMPGPMPTPIPVKIPKKELGVKKGGEK